MRRTLIAMLATTALTVPAIAQQTGQTQGMQQNRDSQQTDRQSTPQQSSGEQNKNQQTGRQQSSEQQGQRTGGLQATYDVQSLGADQIRQIQQALNKKGFDAGNVDGNWGDQTRTAIRNFQQAQGIKQQGRLDQQTVSALGLQLDQASMSYSAQDLSQQQIREIQQSLNQKGFDAGSIDGVWNEQTRSALRNFQKSQGMKQTGTLNQKTVSALGVQVGQQQGGSQATTGSGSQEGARRNQQEPQKNGQGKRPGNPQ